MAMNVSSARDDAPLLTGICASLQAEYAHVYRMRVPGSNDYIVLASEQAVAFDLPAADYGDVGTAGRAGEPRIRRGARHRSAPLTDDWAPVGHGRLGTSGAEGAAGGRLGPEPRAAASRSGRTAVGREIERRFLVTGASYREGQLAQRLRQGYLSTDLRGWYACASKARRRA
ncbi:MAG: hypothetical protein IPH86_11965 [bacterium]|nr:hypothetical protein [bacterium]